MRKVNVYAFYQFGSLMKQAMFKHLLRPIIEEEQVPFGYSIEQILEDVAHTAQAFLERTEGYDVPESRKFANEIYESKLGCHQALQHCNSETERQFTFRNFLFECRRSVNEFENALRHEVLRINAFVVAEKGSYDLDKLVLRAQEHFPTDVLEHLPETAVYDFKEAGKCLAFDCYTAMGYHILRAVEALALKYLETLKNAPFTGAKGFGQYVGALGNKKLDVPVRILQRLDELREFERNPINHPDFIVKQAEALPFYGLAQNIVPMITVEIERIETERKATETT